MKSPMLWLALLLALLPLGGCNQVQSRFSSLAHNIFTDTAAQTATTGLSVPTLAAPSSTGYYSIPTGLTLVPTTAEPAVYFDWAREFGSGNTDYGYDITLDANGNAYVTGYTIGALPGQADHGFYDAYVRKYDSTGKVLWTQQFGTQYMDVARSIASDGRSSLYVTGYTNSSFTGQDSAGSKDAFLCRYDEAGKLLWLRQFGTSGDEDAYGVAVESASRIYVAGNTAGTFPGQSSGGKQDCFITRFDTSGNRLWTRQFGSAADDFITNVCADNQGGILMVGRTEGVLPGQSASGYNDSFLAKYDDNGNLVWMRQFGSKSTTNAYADACDPSGNIYVCGWVFDALSGDFKTYAKEAFVRKYDPSGAVVWTRQFSAGGDALAYDVHCDKDGAAYITGSVGGDLPGHFSYSLTTDLYIRKYTPGGAIAWTSQVDSMGFDDGYSIDVEDSGDIFVAGDTNGKFLDQTNPNISGCALVAKFSLHEPATAK